MRRKILCFLLFGVSSFCSAFEPSPGIKYAPFVFQTPTKTWSHVQGWRKGVFLDLKFNKHAINVGVDRIYMLYPEVFYDRDLNATSVYLGYKYFFIDKQHWCFDLHAKVEYAWGTVTDKVYYLFSDFESISPILGAEMSYKLNWFGFGVGLDFIVLNEKSVLNEHPLIFAPYISLQIHFD